MGRNQFPTRVVSVALLAGISIFGIAAQPTIRFEAFDSDSNGSLSLGEFASLPGLRASPELFADLDRNGDRVISRGEWEATPNDGYGMPSGSGASRQNTPPTRSRPPAFLAHGASVPKVPELDRTARPLSEFELKEIKTGRAGANGTKRGMRATPTMPPPALPPESPPK